MNIPITNQQLNPYAINLCTLGRWLNNKLCLPTAAGQLSIRSAEQSCLINHPTADPRELSPQDIQACSWLDGDVYGPLHGGAAVHLALYQLFSDCKVILHSHSIISSAFARLISADQHLFNAPVADLAGQNSATALRLPVLTAGTQLVPQIRQQASQLSSALLIRDYGLVVWGDSQEQAKRQLENWEYLIACELARFNVVGRV